ncbi:hypothetical protein [Amnibacterium kyonggiense]
MRDARRLRLTPIPALLIASTLLFGLTSCTASSAQGGRRSGTLSVSSAVPTERDGDTDDTNSKAFTTQNAHQETLERFDAWVEDQPGVYKHGFIASVADLKHTSMTLLWFGHDPWRNRLVAAGPRFGVTSVTFQQRPQSLASFIATQKRLSDARAQFKALGFTTSTISGIGAEPQPLTMEGTFAKGADRAAIRSLATRIAGQPVVVESGGIFP